MVADWRGRKRQSIHSTAFGIFSLVFLGSECFKTFLKKYLSQTGPSINSQLSRHFHLSWVILIFLMWKEGKIIFLLLVTFLCLKERVWISPWSIETLVGITGDWKAHSWEIIRCLEEGHTLAGKPANWTLILMARLFSKVGSISMPFSSYILCNSDGFMVCSVYWFYPYTGYNNIGLL